MIQPASSTTGRTPLEVARDAGYRAGRLQLARFHGEKQVSYKGRANPVTDVDLQVQEEVLSLLRREFPSFSLLAEESPEAVEGESEFTWIVDPIDGTRNYAAGVPHFAVTIALAYREEAVLGITYDPLRQELFHAQRGGGAFLNDEPIAVSANQRLDQCLLGFDMGYVDQGGLEAIKLVGSLWPGVQSIRVMGSSALGLAYAAAGRIGVYFHHNLAPWDLASGLLLVHEAGGVVTDRQGNPATLHSRGVIAGSPRLHRQFMEATEGLPWRTL